MITLFIIIGLIIFFAVCLWLGVLGFFFQFIFAILGGLGSDNSKSSSDDKFGGGKFGGGGSNSDY